MILINNLKSEGSRILPINTVKGSVNVGEQSKGTSQMATIEMIAHATSIGADAIVDVKYASTSAMSKSSKFIAYGTAVKFV